MVLQFPDPTSTDEKGLLAWGGNLEVETLLTAYSQGIFPWPCEDSPILWFCPPQRAILDFKDFKIPDRLQRELKKQNFTFRINTDFKAVIHACAIAKNRKGQNGTWITNEMIEAYIAFYKAGFAMSFETWNEKDELVGGLYGVKLGPMFAGESMFYKEPNASKFTLIKTVHTLEAQGLDWMDIQVLTPLLKSFGAKEIARSEFLKRLKKSL